MKEPKRRVINYLRKIYPEYKWEYNRNNYLRYKGTSIDTLEAGVFSTVCDAEQDIYQTVIMIYRDNKYVDQFTWGRPEYG